MQHVFQPPVPPVPRTCPFCGEPVMPAPGGFLEAGEYDGKAYAVEGNVNGYQCQNGHGFYAWPDGKAVGEQDLWPFWN